MDRWMGISIATVIAVLLLLVEHWGPWEKLLKQRFHPIANYVLGVLAFSLPLTGLFATWGLYEAIVAMWVVIVVSGLAVFVAYQVDDRINTNLRLKAAETDTKVLREEMIDDEGTQAS